MDSHRKREHNDHMVEELLRKDEKEKHMQLKEEDESSISDVQKTRNETLPDEVIEDTTIDLQLEKYKQQGKCCFCSSEKWRYYVITVFTLLFGFVTSIGFGIFLILPHKNGQSYVKSGIIALSIGIVMLGPGFYGITRIIKLSSRTRRAKASKSARDDRKDGYVKANTYV